MKIDDKKIESDFQEKDWWKNIKNTRSIYTNKTRYVTDYKRIKRYGKRRHTI